MIAKKTLLGYTNLFFSNDYEKDDKIIYKYLKEKYDKLWNYAKKIDETRNYFLEEIKEN